MELVSVKQFEAVETRMREAGFPPEKVKQELSFAVQHINKSAQLGKCTPESRLQSVLNIANIGLSLNPASKEAYLIPRWNNTLKQMECVLEPSYIGLVKLLTDSKSITSIACQIVYEGDAFEIDLANNQNPVKHVPQFGNPDKKIKGVYAIATLHDGSRQVELMDVSEINKIRDRSETYKAYVEGKIKSCTWVSDYAEMCRKTVIKRIYKYLPRTDRMKFIDEAVKADNSEYEASWDQLSYIESLLATSTLDHDKRNDLELEMTVMNSERASKVIEYLKANQQPSDKETLKRLQRG